MADEETRTETEAESGQDSEIDAARMPFMAHLSELRTRLVRSAIALVVGFGICFPFQERLMAFMVEPLRRALPEGQRLVYTNLPEAFFTYLKICFLGGALLALPYILFELWNFVAPGLYKKERRYALGFVTASSLLFLGGAVFGYQIVFPIAFKFFVGFESELIQPLPALNQYFSFSLRLLIAFGAVFELPIVIFFLARMGVVDDKFLRKNRKWAVLLVFVVGAILTPPDVFSQLLMAGPLLVLFEISIIIAKVFGREKEDLADDEAAEGKARPGGKEAETVEQKLAAAQARAGRLFALMVLFSLLIGGGAYWWGMNELGLGRWQTLGLGGGVFLGLGLIGVVILSATTKRKIARIMAQGARLDETETKGD